MKPRHAAILNFKASKSLSRVSQGILGSESTVHSEWPRNATKWRTFETAYAEENLRTTFL